MNCKQVWTAVVLTASVSAIGAHQAQTQQQPPAKPPSQTSAPAQPTPEGQRSRGYQGEMDEARARQLYVSNDHADHGRGVDFERQIEAKALKKLRHPGRIKQLEGFGAAEDLAA